jgi:hypothetical protein
LGLKPLIYLLYIVDDLFGAPFEVNNAIQLEEATTNRWASTTTSFSNVK